MLSYIVVGFCFFFFQAEDGIRDYKVTGVQTCALPISRLAEEHAALRRVATLVAQGAPPAAVFEAVSAEVGRLIGADGATLGRYEADGTATVLGSWSRRGGASIEVGLRIVPEPGTTA